VSGDEAHLGIIPPALTRESIDVTKGYGETVSYGSTIRHGEVIIRITATGKKSSCGKTAELARTVEASGRLKTLRFTIVVKLASPLIISTMP